MYIYVYIYMFACIYTKKIIGASNIPYDINQPTRVGVPSSSIFLCIAKSAKEMQKQKFQFQNPKCKMLEKKNTRNHPVRKQI